MPFEPGDIVFLEAAPHSPLYPGIDCIVLEVDDKGAILKMKAVDPNPYLAKIGFFEEDGEYVSMVHTIINPN